MQQAIEYDESGELTEVPEKVSLPMLIVCYLASIYSIILAIGIGLRLCLAKKKLDDGSKIYFYDERTRKHGLTMIGIAVVLYLIGLAQIV